MLVLVVSEISVSGQVVAYTQARLQLLILEGLKRQVISDDA